jgi:hypothetical protein
MEIERCHREIAAIEPEILAGNPDLQGLCLALSAELRILQNENEKRRQELTRRRETSGVASQALTE